GFMHHLASVVGIRNEIVVEVDGSGVRILVETCQWLAGHLGAQGVVLRGPAAVIIAPAKAVLRAWTLCQAIADYFTDHAPVVPELISEIAGYALGFQVTSDVLVGEGDGAAVAVVHGGEAVPIRIGVVTRAASVVIVAVGESEGGEGGSGVA